MWLLGIVFSGFIAGWVYLDARDLGLAKRRSLLWMAANFFVPIIGLLVYVFVEHGRVPVITKPSIEHKAGLFVVLVSLALVFFVNDWLQNGGLRTDPTIAILHGLVIAVLPFLVAGVVVSALLRRWLPEFRPGQMAWSAAAVIGAMVIPLTVFGLIPVARRLLLKGFPRGAVFGMLFVGSVANPVVGWTLYVALGRDLQTTLTTLAAAALGALLVGWLMALATQDEPQPAETGGFESVVSEGPGGIGGFCERGLLEFCEYGKYLLVGGVYAALLAVMIPKGALLGLSQSAASSGLPGVLTAFAVPTAPMGAVHFGSSYAAVWQGAGGTIAFLLFSLTCAPAAFALLFAATKPRVAGLYLGLSLVYALVVSVALAGSQLF